MSRRCSSSATNIGAWLLCAAALAPVARAWEALEPHDPLANEQGKVFGFATQDPDLVYLRPDGWRLHDGRAYLEVGADGQNDLFFVLSPGFGDALVMAGQSLPPRPTRALLPLPARYVEASLALPDVLGSVIYEAKSDPAGAQSQFLYYRLRLDGPGLDTLRALAAGNVPLTGHVTYRYTLQGEARLTTAPINVRLSATMLSPRQRPQEYGVEWLTAMLTAHELVMDGAVDGRYSLGTLDATVTSSVLSGRFDMRQTVVTRHAAVYQTTPAGVNFSGRLSFDLDELGTHFEVDLQAKLAMSLDTSQATVTVGQVEVTHVEGGTASAFLTALARRFLSTPEARASISARLSEELQDRILGQDLFF